MQSNWKNFIPALLIPIIAGVFLYWTLDILEIR